MSTNNQEQRLMITIAKTRNINQRLSAAYRLGLENGREQGLIGAMRKLKQEIDDHECANTGKLCRKHEITRQIINKIGKRINS